MCEIGTNHPGTDKLLRDIQAAEDVIDPSRTPPPTQPTVLAPRYEDDQTGARITSIINDSVIRGLYMAINRLKDNDMPGAANLVRERMDQYKREHGVHP